MRVTKGYIERDDGDEDDEVTFLQMILKRKKIPLKFLIDFTSVDWLEQLSAAGIKNYKDLTRAIKKSA